jgi:hypothetical protein
LGGERLFYKGIGFGGEVGYARWGGYGGRTGIGSADIVWHFRSKAANGKADPFVLGGYTLMFNHYVASAANFGGGVNLWVAKHAALRLEVRDETHSPLSPEGWRQILEFRAGLTFR